MRVGGPAASAARETMRRMRIGTLRRGRTQEAGPGVAGTARLDRRTKNLTKRLRPGDIAVIDHVDIDRVSADALVGCKVAAVVNAAPSISGRYPEPRPRDPARRRHPAARRRRPGRVRPPQGGRRRSASTATSCSTEDGTVLAEGVAQDARAVAAAMAEAKAGLSTQLEAFAANTMEYMKRERALLLDGVGVPDVATADRRPARRWSSSAATTTRRTCTALRPYIRDYRPVLIGVDGGADALRRGRLPARHDRRRHGLGQRRRR